MCAKAESHRFFSSSQSWSSKCYQISCNFTTFCLNKTLLLTQINNTLYGKNYIHTVQSISIWLPWRKCSIYSIFLNPEFCTIECSFMLYPHLLRMLTVLSAWLPLNPWTKHTCTHSLFFHNLPTDTTAGCCYLPPGKSCPYQFLISVPEPTCPKLQLVNSSSPP